MTNNHFYTEAINDNVDQIYDEYELLAIIKRMGREQMRRIVQENYGLFYRIKLDLEDLVEPLPKIN